MSQKTSVFRQGFVPSFIRNRAPVVQNVATQNNAVGARPVLRPMAPPWASQPAAPSAPTTSTEYQLARPTLTPMRAPNAVGVREKNTSAIRERQLRTELNKYKNLSQEDVNTFVNDLVRNRATLKNITVRAKRQNELYAKKKEQIKKKLENVKNQMTVTQKNIYKARLNAIPRGRKQSYLNNIERDLLKDIQTSEELRKRADFRKELMANKGTELDTKYRSLYNKYSSNANRQILNRLYNSLKSRPPRINTNAKTLTMKEVVQMLNRNSSRREQAKVTNAITRLMEEYNRKTNTNASNNELQNLEKQLKNAQQKRIALLKNQLSKLRNLERRAANENITNQIEQLEVEVQAAEEANVRVNGEVQQIKNKRKTKTALAGATAAAEARAAAAAKAKANA
ncbi:MAG: hypothetical protein ACO24B_08585, partial [Ilumatobacteraceae bacterium]